MRQGTTNADIVRLESNTKTLPTHPAARREYQFHREVTLQSMAYLFAMDCGVVQTASQSEADMPPPRAA